MNIKLVKNYNQIRPDRATLFCFPFAGGGASAYNSWVQKMKDKVTVCPIQLPGREERIMEKPYNNMTDWNIISFNSDDAEVGQILVKLEISNTSAYKMTGIVAALLAIRSAQTKRKSGIWNAYETIQMQYVFEKLQEEGVFIKETQEVSAVYEESEETGIL